MTDAEVLVALNDPGTLGLTMWAEARAVPRDDDSHSPVEELIAVGVVVRNRRAHFARWRAADDSYKALCLAPNQFSCWTPGSGANHDLLMNLARGWLTNGSLPDPVLSECLYLAEGVIANVLLDRTGGSTSYFAPAAMVPPGRIPSWAKGKSTLKIGDQLFLSV
jgi:hypothetical protein